MPIDRDEFKSAVDLIRADIKGVNDRLDDLNGRTRSNEQEIVRLQEQNKSQESRWGSQERHWLIGTAMGAIAVVGELVHRIWK